MAVDSQIAWEGKQFKVVLAPVQYPDGSTHIHEQIESPDVVRVYAVRDGAVLVIDEYRADVARRVLRVPAGRVEAGESAREAALRELREEAGLTAGRLELIRESTPVLKFRYKVSHFLAAAFVEGDQDLQDGEDIKTSFLPLAEVEDFVFEGNVPEDGIALTLLILARRERAGGLP